MSHGKTAGILLARLAFCLILFVLSGFTSSAAGAGTSASAQDRQSQGLGAHEQNGICGMNAEIVLAGGCFWGVQEYFSRLPGVIATEAGYAQSSISSPGYREVCTGDTGAAEAVRITYNPELLPLRNILLHFFRIIDPTVRNRQGNDIGTQYRTGIYFTNEADRQTAANVMAEEKKKYSAPIVVELEPLVNFYPAEEYHQGYLKKNPQGYCHISFASVDDPALAPKPDVGRLKKTLTPEEWRITRENGTEPPFSGKYWNFDEPGIYVDIASGEPLFSSADKFASSCGWPAFAAPIHPGAVVRRRDQSHGMERVETRSRNADSHLGHVFNDGPKELGGLRYCINSAAIRFIPLADMERLGYGAFINKVTEQMRRK